MTTRKVTVTVTEENGAKTTNFDVVNATIPEAYNVLKEAVSLLEKNLSVDGNHALDEPEKPEQKQPEPASQRESILNELEKYSWKKKPEIKKQDVLQPELITAPNIHGRCRDKYGRACYYTHGTHGYCPDTCGGIIYIEAPIEKTKPKPEPKQPELIKVPCHKPPQNCNSEDGRQCYYYHRDNCSATGIEMDVCIAEKIVYLEKRDPADKPKRKHSAVELKPGDKVRITNGMWLGRIGTVVHRVDQNDGTIYVAGNGFGWKFKRNELVKIPRV